MLIKNMPFVSGHLLTCPLLILVMLIVESKAWIPLLMWCVSLFICFCLDCIDD